MDEDGILGDLMFATNQFMAPIEEDRIVEAHMVIVETLMTKFWSEFDDGDGDSGETFGYLCQSVKILPVVHKMVSQASTCKRIFPQECGHFLCYLEPLVARMGSLWLNTKQRGKH